MRTRAAAEPHGPAALLTAYLDELQGHEALRVRASLVLPRLLAQLEERGRRELRAVQAEDIVAFARHLATVQKKHAADGTRLADATQACYLDAVRRFFTWLQRRGVLLESPAQDLRAPRVLRLPRRVLSEAEARRLMDAPSRFGVLGLRDRAVLEVLYGCGLRRGECLRLDLVDLDLAQRLLLVRTGKGKRDRLLPLTGQAVKALDRYLQDSRPELAQELREEALFLSRYGQRMGRTCLYLLLGKHARAAGLRGVFPHALRHSYATHLLQGRASIRHVQELLGHQSLQATAIYTRVSVEDLREVLTRCHPRERRRGRRT